MFLLVLQLILAACVVSVTSVKDGQVVRRVAVVDRLSFAAQKEPPLFLFATDDRARFARRFARAAACGKNERRIKCGTVCEPTCADPAAPCGSECVPDACRCDIGYIRHLGSCISRKCFQLLKAESKQKANQACPVNERYVACMPCESVCNRKEFLCYSSCVDGCACHSGLVRDTSTGSCVRRFRCGL
ncbi:hypothetical protein Q1695_007355 [Nippostrongylus brasiliensis]|nr:hypothetical protein Q1695_007355 [Nippostrongylus brasiliensis]